MVRSLSLTRNLTRNLHTLDRFVLDALSTTRSVDRPNLPQLIQQYLTHSGRVLDVQLAHESRPSSSRRVSLDNNSCDIHLIAHIAREGDRNKITLSSGFAIHASDGQPILVTCAHTLEEVRHIYVLINFPRSIVIHRFAGLHFLSSLMHLILHQLHCSHHKTSPMCAPLDRSSFLKEVPIP